MNKLDIIRNILTAARLLENWDTYGAKPMERSAIVNAIAFVVEELPEVPTPAVVPWSAGYLQFEWNLGGAWMEIDVYGDGGIAIDYGIYRDPDEDICRVGRDHLSMAFSWLMQQAKAKEET